MSLVAEKEKLDWSPSALAGAKLNESGDEKETAKGSAERVAKLSSHGRMVIASSHALKRNPTPDVSLIVR